VECSSMIKTTRSGRALIFCFLLIVGCAGKGDGTHDSRAGSNPGEVEILTSEAELEAYLKDQFARSVNVDMRGINGAPETDGGGPTDDGAGAPGTGDYSQTNIQESGVDESDVVKTDGAYLYVASDDGVQVVDISGDMAAVASVGVDGQVDALFLYGDKLVVLYGSYRSGGDPWAEIAVPMAGQRFGMPYWIPVESRQGVAIFDISDPPTPTQLKTFEFDGYLVSSRLIQGKLHLVQQFVPDLPPLAYWYDGNPEALEETITANRKAIADMSLAQLIPHFREISPAGDPLPESPLVAAEDFYCPVSRDGGGTITTVVTFDLDDAALPFTSAGIVADAHIVYASPTSLYTATHKYLYGAEVSEETTLFRFDLTGEHVRYVGGGVIPGWILNQFSLGEYEGILRVATTSGHAGGWGPTASNQVYCLQLEGETLKTIGKLEDLAPGEQIYAVRFMGARGYLVTFVKIDPLFTLDLTDPAAPKVAGELKVPGYSDYIHPYGDDYLITVGKDALFVEEDDMAWYQGVQLSIFDVSDFSDPVLLHKEILGDRGTSSEASHNHKAFTFWPTKNLLALPIDLYEHAHLPEDPWEYGQRTFSGLYVYRLSSETGFDLLGRLSTRDEDAQMAESHWSRGVFVEEEIYAVTKDAVRSAPVDHIDSGVEIIYLETADAAP
jgi:inhibitor of cysteine peptidase